MGVSSPDVGYRGYWVSDVALVSDATEYTTGGGAWSEKITGFILTDISSSSKLRFKVALAHSVAAQYVYFKVLIGNIVIWEQSHTGGYANYTIDKLVTWKRGNAISVQIKATVWSGKMKDFSICGYITPLALN